MRGEEEYLFALRYLPARCCSVVKMMSLRMDAGDGAMREHEGVEYCVRRDGLDDARRGSAADNDSSTDGAGDNASARGERKGEERERKAAKKRK